MYATQQLEGGGGFLYYALEWDLSCNSSTPVPMSGSYSTPQFCPYCEVAFTAAAAGAQRSGRASVDEFPGYPGPILREVFNPVTARPEDGGFPDTPGWTRPTIVDEKPFRFTDSFGMTVYIKVFTVSLKIREACRAQHHPHCDDMPEYFLAKIGYQVVPEIGNEPNYLDVRIEPLSRKLVRAYTGTDSNKEESALVILGRGF